MNRKIVRNNQNTAKYYPIAGIFAVVVLILLLITIYRTYGQFNKGMQIVEKSKQEVELLKKEKEELELKVAKTDDPHFADQLLRDKLGMAKEGEIVVVLPPADELAKLAPVYGEKQEIVEIPNWEKWVRVFF
jgi:cell division protein FtsB